MTAETGLKADLVLLELDPRHGHLKLGFGASFYLHLQRLWFNRNPHGDPILAPFVVLAATPGMLHLNVPDNKEFTHLRCETVYEGTDALIPFLAHYRQHDLALDSTGDEIRLTMDEDGFTLKCINPNRNARIVITYSNRHGNTFLERFPEPSKRYRLQSCMLEDKVLQIRCTGPDLHASGPSESGCIYQWPLDIQPVLAPLVTGLIRAAIEKEIR